MFKLPLGDPEEIPANTLHGQPDEDFWINPVAPVQVTLFQRITTVAIQKKFRLMRFMGNQTKISGSTQSFQFKQRYFKDLPLGDPEEIPANTLSGQPDEDFWVNAVGLRFKQHYFSEILPLEAIKERNSVRQFI